MDEKKPKNPLDGLRGIADDLWASTLELSKENTVQLEQLTRELQKDQATWQVQAPADQIEMTTQGQVLDEKKAEAPKFPSFESVWKAADETVDWTDALAYPRVRDGITPQSTWTFYHEHAEAVLQGDVRAYLTVLKEMNPLGDLTTYGRAFNVHAENADHLSVTFEALPINETENSNELERYLSGMALRIARDLFALLPVRKVSVLASVDGKEKLNVTFDKSELQSVRFTTSDPIQLVSICGGKFAE